MMVETREGRTLCVQASLQLTGNEYEVHDTNVKSRHDAPKGGCMFRWMRELWVGSDLVEFESSFGLAESVERLKAATRHWAMFTPFREAAVGTVTDSRVSLRRVIPMVGNSFKPFFVGRFQVRQNQVVLTGRFALHWSVKLFMGLWFGFGVLYTALASFAAVPAPHATYFPLVGLALVACGIGLIRISMWFSRNDRAWLSDVIRTALSNQVAIASKGLPPDELRSSPKRPPTVIVTVTAVLAFQGLMLCVSAITDIQPSLGDPSGSVFTHYADVRLRYLAGIYGAVTLPLAFDVYRQRMFAWRMGFLALLGGIAIQTLGLLARENLGNTRSQT
jgi:hypothetical protein